MKYEYCEEVIRPASSLAGFSDGDLAAMHAKMNTLGTEGWELVTLQSVKVGWLLIYKRGRK